MVALVSGSSSQKLPQATSIEDVGQGKEDVIRKVIGADCQLTNIARSMILTNDFPQRTVERDIRIKIQSLRKLGLGSSYPAYDLVVRRITDMGGRLCAPEVAPLFRAQYDQQRCGTSIIVFSKCITVDGAKLLFELKSDSGGNLSLDGTLANPMKGWHPDTMVAFEVQ